MDAMQKSWGMFEINCEKSHPLPFSFCVGEPRVWSDKTWYDVSIIASRSTTEDFWYFCACTHPIIALTLYSPCNPSSPWCNPGQVHPAVTHSVQVWSVTNLKPQRSKIIQQSQWPRRVCVASAWFICIAGRNSLPACQYNITIISIYSHVGDSCVLKQCSGLFLGVAICCS